LGARLLAGEKCCCSVENAGRRTCDSPIVDFGLASSRVGGRRIVEAVKFVEDDCVRVWDGTRVLAESTPADGFRKCRDVVIGGLERSCLTGSALTAVFETRFDDDLCSPADAGLLMLAREGGGRIAPLLVVFPVELGGLLDVAVLRVEGLTGRRLGD
jgi:hypothetical protein